MNRPLGRRLCCRSGLRCLWVESIRLTAVSSCWLQLLSSLRKLQTFQSHLSRLQGGKCLIQYISNWQSAPLNLWYNNPFSSVFQLTKHAGTWPGYKMHEFYFCKNVSKKQVILIFHWLLDISTCSSPLSHYYSFSSPYFNSYVLYLCQCLYLSWVKSQVRTLYQLSGWYQELHSSPSSWGRPWPYQITAHLWVHMRKREKMYRKREREFKCIDIIVVVIMWMHVYTYLTKGLRAAACEDIPWHAWVKIKTTA